MIDALLASDQHFDTKFLAEKPYAARVAFWPKSPLVSGNNALYGEQTLQDYGLVRHKIGHPLPNGNAPSLDTYLCKAEAALAKAAKSTERRRRADHFQEEMQWLAENRSKYRGNWIALQGRQLLAVGSTAKEVFSQVAGQTTPPLVIKVEDDELPFGGW